MDGTKRLALRNHWAVASLTGGGILVTFLLRNNISPVTPILKQQLHITNLQLGLALSAFLWAYTFLQPVAGWAADNYGARTTLLVGVFAASVLTLLTGFVTSLIALITLRVALGVAQAPNFVTGAKVSSSSWVPEGYRARATSVWIAGGRLGTAIAISFAGLLAVSLGWQWAFFGTGLLGFLWCATWVLGFNNNPQDVPNSKLPIEQRLRFRQNLPALLNPLALGLAVASFGQGYFAYYVSTWLPDYLVTQQNFTVLESALLSTLPIIAAVFTIILIGGFLSDREVNRGASRVGFRSNLFSLGMVGTSIMIFITAYSRNIALAASISSSFTPYFAVVTLTLAGAAWGVATPSLWAALVEATPKRVTGSMGGIQNFGGNLGGIVVLVLTGFILDTTKDAFLALVAVSGFSLLAAFSAFLLVRPRSPPRSIEN